MSEEKIKLTAILKTKNNEDRLCDTLESIKDFDEIIVIDEHSNDDTVAIAQEYKAKIIYADKNNLQLAQNQALNEANNEWIFILGENEIIPQKLAREIETYILNPKKNKNAVTLCIRNSYLNKEIKASYEKNVLRLFKKDYAEFLNDYSLELKLKSGKIHKIKPNSKTKNACILRFSENDILKYMQEAMEKNRNIFKKVDKISASVFVKPMFEFIYWYFIKGAVFEGKRGFIFAKKKYIESFILQVMILEKSFKGEN